MSHSPAYQPKPVPLPGILTGTPLPHAGPVRHPLGLPRGSVRAVLAFMVLGTVWTLLLVPAEKVQAGIPPYLFYLTFLIVGCYFGARATAPYPLGPWERHPLYLPRGSIRALIILGFIGTFALAYHHDPEFYKRIRLGSVSSHPLLPFVLFGGFFVGVVVNWIAGLVLRRPTGMPAWYQDVLAWVSVLAVFGLSFEVIYQLVVVTNSASASEMPLWQSILAAIVAFYFGART